MKCPAKKSAGYAADKVREMVGSFNSLWSGAQSGHGSNTRLYDSLAGAMNAYGPALERIGVSAGKTGSLSVDQAKLAAASEDGSLQSFFTQTGAYGFSTRISSIAGNAERNPAYYVGNAAGSYSSGGASLKLFCRKRRRHRYVQHVGQTRLYEV